MLGKCGRTEVNQRQHTNTYTDYFPYVTYTDYFPYVDNVVFGSGNTTHTT